MLKQSQDTFMVGKSIFKQCIEPKCFYASGSSGKCKEHCDHPEIKTGGVDNVRIVNDTISLPAPDVCISCGKQRGSGDWHDPIFVYNNEKAHKW